MGLPGLNQCLAEDKVSPSRTQHSASSESQTSNPLIQMSNMQSAIAWLVRVLRLGIEGLLVGA